MVIMVLGWCGFHVLIFFAQEFWQIAIFRALSIFFSAGYVSVGPAVIADYFPNISRGIGKKNFHLCLPISLLYLLVQCSGIYIYTGIYILL